MKIYGSWSGHDCSFAVLNNGIPEVHAEYERYIREKEPAGDSLQFMFDEIGLDKNMKYYATCLSADKLKQHKNSLDLLKKTVKKNGGEIYILGHHQAHAANAFFSSNVASSLIVTIDGGGYERDDSFSYKTLEENDEKNTPTAFTIWEGKNNKIRKVKHFPINKVNIGGVWTRCTRYIFKLQSGYPRGHQAGTVMAMAALGDSSRFRDDFYRMIKYESSLASYKPPNQPRGAYTGNDPIHPYLNKWSKVADQSEKDKFDLAAGLQAATEDYLKEIFEKILKSFPEHRNLCLSGGVTLNSVAMGKMYSWFGDRLDNIYITPTPHDGGLSIGAAQYVWHQILDNPRIEWKDNFTPYLGLNYEIDKYLKKYNNIEYDKVKDEKIINLLDQQKIVAVFGGGSESGRRALGNRSILADPRSPKMKELINEKVKHRQWFRPFAPSILREEVKNWFETDRDSPYMSFVFKFKDSVASRVPAVVHFDQTARLQTVTKNDNNWYYSLIKKWQNKTGVPILLNTSFNDREPICETPEHAINCFLRTDIDYLYFYDHKILIKKKSGENLEDKE